MTIFNGFRATMLGAAIVIALPQVASALTINTVDRIARATTVLIDGLNPGSGVIVARQGDRYSVLTAKHVVETEDEYTIVAPDGRRYPLNYATVQLLPGVDLALLEFESDRAYEVATLAQYPDTTQFRHVFVSGWANAEAQQSHRLAPGLLMGRNFALTHAKDPMVNGYELFYTSITELGMSGGPVFDTDGRAIGIHGRVEGEEIYDNTSGQVFRIKLGFSSGIPIQTFLRLAPETGTSLNLRVENRPPSALTPQESANLAAALRLPPVQGNLSAINWINRGNELYRVEQFNDSLQAFDRAIALNSNLYQAWYGRAQALYVLGRYPEALSAYDRVLQSQPRLPIVWRNKGVILTLIGQPQEALSAFDRATRLQPDDYISWYLRGNLFRTHLEAPQAALGSYDRAIQIQPNFADAWTGRGKALGDIGNFSAALTSFDRATHLNPNLGDAWHWRGLLLLDLGRFESALNAFDRAISISANDPQLWLYRGISLANLGRYGDAAESAQRALNIEPRDREILEFLNSLSPFLP
ncbi:tetratricopeptide repeat protein [Lusitaniella coriacea]|uniref:tetratricopeptide repeat protein n=1 Tax=Lusitaniella coriacea TaxID=1983105 RepID=UPI003CF61145